MKLKKGLVHIYTGEGKGKTTSALGLALRAARYGLKVCFIQFMKGYTERATIKKIGGVTYKYFGYARKAGKWKWVYKGKIKYEDKKLAEKGLVFAKNALLSKKFDVVILDEIIMAIWFGLIDEERVIKLIKSKPENIELILTGRRASKALINVADYVSEIRKIKHPFDKGILARKGIDF